VGNTGPVTTHSAPARLGRRWYQPMRPRDPQQQHRASTPLELLFDLTLVVAVAAVAAELHHALAEGDLQHALGGYVAVFFAIWWAWMNFTWFASAYDVDDVPYRLSTLLQMAGVLVLAAGIPAAFEQTDFTAVTIGYVLMRVALVAQWLRAGHGDPQRRSVALRYALGVSVVQVGWLLRLPFAPHASAVFALLAIAELLVPIWAERGGPMTSWHPDHIIERYSLFTLIVLGESILACSTAVQTSFGRAGLSVDLLTVAIAGLAIVFALWWLYFDGAGRSEVREQTAFLWGYSHYAVFAGVAALGAGLQLATDATAHEVEPSRRAVLLAIAVPVGVFLLVVSVLTAPVGGFARAGLTGAGQAAGVLLVALAAAAALPLAAAVAAIAAALTGLVGWSTLQAHRAAVGPA
jgi:low temperature requirement protein LtrA